MKLKSKLESSVFLHVAKLTIQKISDFLHVDFHVRDTYSEFKVARRFHDTGKDLFNNAWCDTLGTFIIDIGTLVYHVS